LEKWQAYQASGEFPIPALHLAADDVLLTQTESLALQRRIGSDMRDIWAMQPRFERRVGKSPYKLIEHPRFRAGLDFLVLRAASGEIEQEFADWWTEFLAADNAGREVLLAAKPLRTAKKPALATDQKKPQINKMAASHEIGDAATSDTSTSDAPPASTTKKRRRRPRKPAGGE